jgi:type IV pilus assembly protein PilY1
VDGPLTESDAYIGTWTNVAIGSAGAGGKAIFAFKLDTGNPANVSSSSVLWELSADSQNTKAANLGYVTSRVVVGRMANGKWAAVFGNGMDSSAGTAALWIVDLATGKPMVDPILAGTETGNGLGGVTLVRNAQRVVIAAYAGDALGRLWRFDLQDTTSANWKVALGGNTPLINTGKAITAAPAFVAHPKGGLMVLFGSGKLYANGDEANTTTQSLYGVWDVTPYGQPSSTGTGASISQLVKPTVVTTTTVTASGGKIKGYTINPANPAITFTDYAGKRGWTIDMVIAAGERSIYNPSVLPGYVSFVTMAPKTQTQGDPCIAQSSSSWRYTVNPLTGEMPPYSLYDTNGNVLLGVVERPAEDQGEDVYGSVPPKKCVDGVCSTPCPTGVTNCGIPDPANCDPGSAGVTMGSSGQATGTCNASLHVQRTWRQIVNFPKSTATGN